MCLTCGCHLPLTDHGDARNITHQDLVAAAEAADITPDRAVANLVSTEQATGDSVDPADLFAAAAARPTIVCDIDGVLAWTAEAILTALNARFGLSLLVEQMTSYSPAALVSREQAAWLDRQLQWGPFYANLAPDHHALDALDTLHTAGFELTVCTERPDTAQTATSRWLSTWDVPHDRFAMPGRGGKPGVLAPYGPTNPAVLIDDDPSKWLTVARGGVPVWTPSRPWTPANWQHYPNVWVFTAWDELVSRLGVS